MASLSPIMQQPTYSDQAQAIGKNSYLASGIGQVAKNIGKIAIPAIALFALTYLPGASAGPLSYSACCLGCTSLFPPAVPLCLVMCGPVLFLPSP